jgi:hypothetical protein
LIVLDTTVLVYATGAAHPLRDPCVALLEAIADARVAASTTPEVVQEFVHVRARRGTRQDAVELGRSFIDLLSPLVPVEERHVSLGLDLFQRHMTIGAFDALLAAVALESGAVAVVSADQAFSRLPGLRHVAPGTRAFDRLLRRS